MFRIAMYILGLSVLIAPMAMVEPLVVQEAQDTGSLKETAGTIDIMRRVLVKSINRDLAERFGDKDEDQEAPDSSEAMVSSDETTPESPVDQALFSYGYAVTGGTVSSFFGSYGSFAGDSRGHYVPGHGAIFSLEVSLPRIPEKADDEGKAAEDESKDDLWNEATMEAQGGTTAVARALLYDSSNNQKLTRWVIDPKGVNTAIDTVVATVANYGGKIAGLGADESIIVALDIRGGAGRFVDRTSSNAPVVTSFSNVYLSQSDSGSDSGRHVIIEVSMGDVARYTDKRLDVDGLRSRAKITRY